MIAKANAKILVKNPKDLKLIMVELRDVDIIQDDIIERKSPSNDGSVEFIFSTSITGEDRPDLQLRVYKEKQEVWRSEIDNTISFRNVNKLTGRVETTTVDFGAISIE